MDYFIRKYRVEHGFKFLNVSINHRILITFFCISRIVFGEFNISVVNMLPMVISDNISILIFTRKSVLERSD